MHLLHIFVLDFMQLHNNLHTAYMCKHFIYMMLEMAEMQNLFSPQHIQFLFELGTQRNSLIVWWLFNKELLPKNN